MMIYNELLIEGKKTSILHHQILSHRMNVVSDPVVRTVQPRLNCKWCGEVSRIIKMK